MPKALFATLAYTLEEVAINSSSRVRFVRRSIYRCSWGGCLPRYTVASAALELFPSRLFPKSHSSRLVVHETYLFRARADGRIQDWGELTGSSRGTLEPEVAFNRAGYRVLGPPSSPLPDWVKEYEREYGSY